jgi:hypothetical protein
LVLGTSAGTGGSSRLVRTLIETAVLVAGFLLGGSVGIGTVLYALVVGPTTRCLLPRFAYKEPAAPAAPSDPRRPPPVTGPFPGPVTVPAPETSTSRR